MQLLLDGYAQDYEFLTSTERIRLWLMRVVGEIGMKAVNNPIVIDYGKGSGLTGFIPLGYRESHIVISTWSEEMAVQLDCFSCKEFNAAIIVGSLCKDAVIEHPSTLILRRGIVDGKLVPAQINLGITLAQGGT